MAPIFKNQPVQGDGSRRLGRLPRLLDHRLHPGRPALRHQRGPRDAHRQGARQGHEGLLRRHHQPHRRRRRLQGEVLRLPLQGRLPVPDEDGEPFDDADYADGGPGFPSVDAGSFPRTPSCPPRRRTLKVPSWLNDPTMYHNRGDSTFAGESSTYGDFSGLDDLWTERPEVVSGMEKIYQRWVRDFDIDGFRIDTVKHVNTEFWTQWATALDAYAAEAGPGRLLHVRRGVLRRHVDHLPVRHPGPPRRHAGLPLPGRGPAVRLPGRQRAAARLGLRRRLQVHDRQGQRVRAGHLPRQPRHGPHRELPQAGQPEGDRRRAAREGPARQRADVPQPRQPRRLLRRRAGLHRRGRRQGRPPDDVRLEDRRLPRRRRDRHRPHARRATPTTRAPRSTSRSALSSKLRKTNPALADGVQTERYAADGAGVYAFSRTDAKTGTEYVVAFNNADEAEGGDLRDRFGGHDVRAGSTATDGTRSRADADKKLTVTVPAGSAVVLKAAGRPAKPATKPTITLKAPADRRHRHRRADRATSDGGRLEPGRLRRPGRQRQVADARLRRPRPLQGHPDHRQGRTGRNRPALQGGRRRLGRTHRERDGRVHHRHPARRGDPHRLLPRLRDRPLPARPTATTTDWGLYAWGDIADGEATTWPDGHAFIGRDAYGAFAYVKLKPGASNVGFLVIDKDGNKDVSADRTIDVTKTGEVWIEQGKETVRTRSRPPTIRRRTRPRPSSTTTAPTGTTTAGACTSGPAPRTPPTGRSPLKPVRTDTLRRGLRGAAHRRCHQPQLHHPQGRREGPAHRPVARPHGRRPRGVALERPGEVPAPAAGGQRGRARPEHLQGGLDRPEHRRLERRRGRRLHPAAVLPRRVYQGQGRRPDQRRRAGCGSTGPRSPTPRRPGSRT